MKRFGLLVLAALATIVVGGVALAAVTNYADTPNFKAGVQFNGIAFDYLSATHSSSMDVVANVCKSSSAITVTGADVGDPCTLGQDATTAALNIEFSCYVSATNAAKIKLCNLTGSTINANAGVYTLFVKD